jgi:hypothetical protein
MDNALVVFHNPQMMMDAISAKYSLKAGSIKEPDTYLHAEEIHKYNIKDSDDPTKT